jgi:hypothetical protein
VAAPLEHGSHESTFSQAQLLLAALDATAEQQAKIAAAFHPFLSQEKAAHAADGTSAR